MNAVPTKIRKPGDSAGKTKTPPLSPLEIVRSELRSAYCELEMARDATDIGDPAHALLNLADELMRSQIAVIGHDSLTRLIVGRVYEAMFATLAILQGVMALTKGTVAFHTVQQAHALLDNAHTALDVGPVLDALPLGDKETEFSSEPDMAIEKLITVEGKGDLAPAAHPIEAPVDKPLRHWHQATAAAEMTSETVGGNDLFWAALALMEHADGEITAARTKGAAELASLTMCQAIAVLHACNTSGLGAGGHGLEAAITLAELAKEEFDVVIDDLPTEVHYA